VFRGISAVDVQIGSFDNSRSEFDAAEIVIG
jgi:hypothetical protein